MMELYLQPLEIREIPQSGESFVYLSGAHTLAVQAEGERAEIPSGSSVRFPKFSKITVQNKGTTPVLANVIVCDGEFRKLFEGSTVSATIQNQVDVIGRVDINSMPSVQAEVTNALNIASLPSVQAEVMNQVDVSGSSVSISSMPSVQAEVTNALNIASLPSVQAEVTNQVDVSGSSVSISSMPAVTVASDSAQNVETSEYEILANDSLLISARANRKRLFIQAYIDSESTVFARVSHDTATANTGAVLVCGGGLLGELEQYHSDTVRIWNTSATENITVHVLEEF
ncbi:hypothetical protein CBF23_003220 [Marinomonas agarivorans]|nr:hypothetical protein CBF23_003220 [Marinomonas agarivorans]